MNWSMIKKYITIAGIAVIVLLFSLWRISVSNYESEKKAREQVEIQLQATQQEVQNLTKFNKELEKQNAAIEKEYAEIYKNIPADTCGDVKPSKELLNYLSQGVR